MKKVIFLLLAVLMISTIFVGCDKNLASALASKAKHISLNPDIINIKVGKTIEVTAKITDGNDQTVTVDNSKFEWSIVTGEDAISIVPNGNTVKITAKKTLIGNAMIKISHPEALTYIQRVVHITKGEEGGNTGNINLNINGDIEVDIGETIEVTAKITDEKGQIITVDNSKFAWSVVWGSDKIKIEPNGNTVKITAKEVVGSAEIRVTHPDVDHKIERNVKILPLAKYIFVDPDIINVKVGETIEVTAKTTDGNNQTVTVDNSKFKWSIDEDFSQSIKEAIDIVPNGNKAKITAKKAFVKECIKISHPDVLFTRFIYIKFLE